MRTYGDHTPTTLARWLACALLAAAGAAMATETPADHIVLRVMEQESIAPKWVPGASRPQGLCPEFLTAIEKIEPRIRFSAPEHGRSLPVIEAALESGKAGAACALLDSPRRRSIAQVVGKPLYLVKHRLAAAANDDVVINNLDDLVKLKPLVNTARGSAYILQLKALGVAVDDSTGDNAINLRKVLAGHGRFTYMNELTLVSYIRSEHLEDRIRILPVVLKEEPIYFWISRKADPEAAKLVGQALDKLKANGELARIYERWSRVR
jgi:polar amino acid transport system substrate-binding protein